MDINTCRYSEEKKEGEIQDSGTQCLLNDLVTSVVFLGCFEIYNYSNSP